MSWRKNRIGHPTKSRSPSHKRSPILPFDLSLESMPPVYQQMRDNRSYYEVRKGVAFKIAMISPDDYLDAIHLGFKVRSGMDESKIFSHERVNEYAQQMQAGDKFPLPTLEYKWRYGFSGNPYVGFSQEGHHRALAAKQIGLGLIPVFIEYPYYKSDFDKVEQSGIFTSVIRDNIEPGAKDWPSEEW